MVRHPAARPIDSGTPADPDTESVERHALARVERRRSKRLADEQVADDLAAEEGVDEPSHVGSATLYPGGSLEGALRVPRRRRRLAIGDEEDPGISLLGTDAEVDSRGAESERSEDERVHRLREGSPVHGLDCRS